MRLKESHPVTPSEDLIRYVGALGEDGHALGYLCEVVAVVLLYGEARRAAEKDGIDTPSFCQQELARSNELIPPEVFQWGPQAGRVRVRLNSG